MLLAFNREVVAINLIRRLRINAQMTQQELAVACGVTQGAVSQWEKGLSFPTTRKICTVARVLGCDADKLLELAEQEGVK